MTRVIFVRHGQTVWNVELKYQGQTDTALSELGLEQARLVAARLETEKIAAVYTSDLSRARATAALIAAPHALPVRLEPSLREISFGDWEGLTYHHVNENNAAEMQKLYTQAERERIPGGESFGELQRRAMEGVRRIVAAHPDETVVAVSHGATIRTIICAALSVNLNYVWSIMQDNTSVNIINYYPDRAIIALINDAHHLK